MQQAVNTTQVDERTVIGKVLDDTLNGSALFQSFEQLFALCTVLCLNHRTAGDHNIVALLVQLDHLKLKVLTFKVSGVTYRADVNQ